MTIIRSTYTSDFAFWGKRSYVHGSHMIYGLFDAVETWELGTIDRFIASFRFKLENQGKYLLYADKNGLVTSKGGLCSVYDVHTKKGFYAIGLEMDGREVQRRLPDDEEFLISGCNFVTSDMYATVSVFPRDRLINVMIALNKMLHHNTFSFDSYGPWVLAKIDLQWNLINVNAAEEIEVKIINNIGGKMTRSRVAIDGSVVGEIYFNRKVLS